MNALGTWRKGILVRSEHFLGHVAIMALGFVMMVVGLALGVSMVLLPIGLVVGLAGVLVFLAGAFAPLGRDSSGQG